MDLLDIPTMLVETNTDALRALKLPNNVSPSSTLDTLEQAPPPSPPKLAPRHVAMLTVPPLARSLAFPSAD